MEDLGQNPVILPPQIIEKPASITVFGILNIIFGCLSVICTPFVVSIGLESGEQLGMTAKFRLWILVSAIVRVGFYIWLFVLGIGLLKMKRWARCGSVSYAKAIIAWAVVGEVGMNFMALSQHWIIVPESEMTRYIVGTFASLVGLIFPILLLIFMQTAKAKRAFSAIEK